MIATGRWKSQSGTFPLSLKGEPQLARFGIEQHARQLSVSLRDQNGNVFLACQVSTRTFDMFASRLRFTFVERRRGISTSIIGCGRWMGPVRRGLGLLGDGFLVRNDNACPINDSVRSSSERMKFDEPSHVSWLWSGHERLFISPRSRRVQRLR